MSLFKNALPLTFAIGAALCASLHAEVSVPNIFGDHMVLQREQANPVWGKADPGEVVAVSIGDQTHSTEANADGAWRIKLDPLPVGGPYELTIKGSNTIQLKDILVGEVWICSGQSNMSWSLKGINNAEVEIASANYPQIRLITVPHVGTQIPQDDFDGQWKVCQPDSAKYFSAIGYLFGRRIHNTTGVPVGLINNAWGGSSAEAWVPREVLESDERYSQLLKNWEKKIADYPDAAQQERIAKYEAWVTGGKQGKTMWPPRDYREGQNRPANLFNGVLLPTIGYGIRGVIWYQGESNGSQPEQYRHLFPLLITTWRDLWQQGDFPFYWVQLADFMPESEVKNQSNWAELREAQTMTLALPNTGEAVIINSGSARDIHPRNKQPAANRLARWALARDYGYDIAYQSPTFSEIEISEGVALVTFDHVSKDGLYAFDVETVHGFTIAGGV